MNYDINNYAQYARCLIKMLNKNGVVSEKDVLNLLESNDLVKRFGITEKDVWHDLDSISAIKLELPGGVAGKCDGNKEYQFLIAEWSKILPSLSVKKINDLFISNKLQRYGLTVADVISDLRKYNGLQPTNGVQQSESKVITSNGTICKRNIVTNKTECSKNIAERNNIKGISVRQQDTCTSNFDISRFELLVESKDILGYIEAFDMLSKHIDNSAENVIFRDITIRLKLLKKSLDEHNEIFTPNMNKFYQYYAPETLKIAETYIKINGEINPRVKDEIQESVKESANIFLNVVNTMIDDIHKYAAIEIKSRTKALKGLMGMDGYVDPSQKIN